LFLLQVSPVVPEPFSNRPADNTVGVNKLRPSWKQEAIGDPRIGAVGAPTP